MKIAVIGSGAMGCFFGSLLSLKNNVSIFGRNKKIVDFINSNGISVNEKIFFPNAFMNGCSDEKYDLALILVKAYDTQKAIEDNINIIKNSSYILTLQNGLGNDTILKNYKSEEYIMLGTTENNSSVIDTGKIYSGGNGITVIGNLNGNSNFLNKTADNFNMCGVETIISENTQKIIWEKLSLNIAVNALTAVFKIPTGKITEKSVMEICSKLIEETVNVAEKTGINLDYNEILQRVISLAKRQPNAFTSMYKDIQNNRKTEIDFLNGAIVKLGDKHNTDVTFNRMITEKIHSLEGLI